MHRTFLLILAAILILPAVASALDQISINVALPNLTCGKDNQQPNECTLSGIVAARGPNTLNGPIKYHCDIRYTFVAAGSDQQEIRFPGRTLHHGELVMTNGRARVPLEVPVTITLSPEARRVELAELACYQDE